MHQAQEKLVFSELCTKLCDLNLHPPQLFRIVNNKLITKQEEESNENKGSGI